MKMQHRMRTGLVAGLLAAVALAGCGSDSYKDSQGRRQCGQRRREGRRLRLGYFPNITHAPALVGVEKGIFAEKLGSNVTLEPKAFNAGPAAVEAIFNGALDATYIGPNPAINAFAKSNGEAIRIVSGATSGGAYLVVNPEINKPADLKGKKHRHPAAGQHAGRGAAQLAEGQQAQEPTPRAAATSRSCPRRTARPSRPSRPARSPAPGCPSPGPPG